MLPSHISDANEEMIRLINIFFYYSGGFKTVLWVDKFLCKLDSATSDKTKHFISQTQTENYVTLAFFS